MLIFVGLCLVFNRQIKKLFSLRKNRKEKPVKQAEVFVEKDALEEVPYDVEEETVSVSEEKIIPQVEPVQVFNQPVEDFEEPAPRIVPNNSGGIRKAQFSLSGDDDFLATPISSGSAFSEPIFGQDDFAQPVNQPIYEEVTPIIDEELPEEIDEFTSDKVIEEETPIEPVKPVIPNVIAEPVVKEEVIVKEETVDKLHRPQPKANPIKNYIYPPIDLLDFHEDPSDSEKNEASTQDTINRINEVFNNLHIGAQVVGSTVGPCVTRYDVQTNSDVSVAQVAKYVEDIYSH